MNHIRRNHKYLIPFITFIAGVVCSLVFTAFSSRQERFIIEHDENIRKNESGPHDGGGKTHAYSFFNSTPNLHLVFRKRVLYPGSSIGYHLQQEDEIYYIVLGKGELTMNGKAIAVSAGDAILTRPGSSHSLKPIGKDSLVVIINYAK